MISEEQVQDIKNTFEAFEMPVTVSGLDWKDVYATTKSDKKNGFRRSKIHSFKNSGKCLCRPYCYRRRDENRF